MGSAAEGATEVDREEAVDENGNTAAQARRHAGGWCAKVLHNKMDGDGKKDSSYFLAHVGYFLGHLERR